VVRQLVEARRFHFKSTVFWLSLCHPSDRRFLRSTVLITIAVVLLRQSSATINGYVYCRNAFGHGRSLRAWLPDEEARYTVAVQGRLELIKK
jgi:hypothetical protein